MLLILPTVDQLPLSSGLTFSFPVVSEYLQPQPTPLLPSEITDVVEMAFKVFQSFTASGNKELGDPHSFTFVPIRELHLKLSYSSKMGQSRYSGQ